MSSWAHEFITFSGIWKLTKQTLNISVDDKDLTVFQTSKIGLKALYNKQIHSFMLIRLAQISQES